MKVKRIARAVKSKSTPADAASGSGAHPPAPWIAATVLADWAEAMPPPIPTGLVTLDESLDGGLCSESVAGIAGGTGRGKTALAVQVAGHIARSRPVFYATSGDMSRRQIEARVLAHHEPELSWVEVLRQPPAAAKDLSARVRDLRLRVAVIRSEPELMGALTDAAMADGQPTVLALDYLQHYARRAYPDLDARGQVTRAADMLAQWATDTRSLALVLSSTSRANSVANGRRGRDLVGTGAESGGIEFDSRYTLYLELDDSGAARLHVAKNTWGRAGQTLGFRYDWGRGIFTPDRAAALTARQREIVEAVRGGAASANAAVEKVSGNRDDLLDEIRDLITGGHLRRMEGRLEVAS